MSVTLRQEIISLDFNRNCNFSLINQFIDDNSQLPNGRKVSNLRIFSESIAAITAVALVIIGAIGASVFSPLAAAVGVVYLTLRSLSAFLVIKDNRSLLESLQTANNVIKIRLSALKKLNISMHNKCVQDLKNLLLKMHEDQHSCVIKKRKMLSYFQHFIDILRIKDFHSHAISFRQSLRNDT